jgi:hypothetical protein
METGGQFNVRPAVEIQTSDSVNPDDFTHNADIVRYYADIERLSTSQPEPMTQLSEMPEDPSKMEDSAGLFASPLENRGFDPEQIKHDNRPEAYQQRLGLLEFLDGWEV